MYLLFDLSGKDSIHLALFNEKKITHERVRGRNRELLSVLDTFLAREGKSKHDIRGIMTVVGEGGFTSTRIAAVVANSFGFAQQIPLLVIKKENIEHIQMLIPTLLKQPAGQYISATYSGEPNIGRKK